MIRIRLNEDENNKRKFSKISFVRCLIKINNEKLGIFLSLKEVRKVANVLFDLEGVYVNLDLNENGANWLQREFNSRGGLRLKLNILKIIYL